MSSLEEANIYIKKHTIDYIIGDTRVNEIESYMKSINTSSTTLVGYSKLSNESQKIKLINSVSESEFTRVLSNQV